eukprot:15252724-Alexandrium_andersonii.AAC.1
MSGSKLRASARSRLLCVVMNSQWVSASCRQHPLECKRRSELSSPGYTDLSGLSGHSIGQGLSLIHI